MISTQDTALRAARFAAVAAGMFATHWPADHGFGQTDKMALGKTAPGPEGVRACLAHVAAYTAASTTTVAALNKALGLGLSARGIAAGQLVNAVTHYYADRDRSRLARIVAATGSPGFPPLGQPRQNVVAYVKAAEGELPLRVVTVDKDGTEHEVSFDNPSLGTGAYAIDQSWHWFWMLVAALVTAVIR